MTPRKKVALTQMRGRWIARVDGSRSIAELGYEKIAVMRDFGNGEFDWKKLQFSAVPSEIEGDRPDWWMKDEQERWRQLLLSGAPVWIRDAKQDGSKTGSVGRSKGVWDISDLQLTGEGLSFRLTDRIAEVMS